MRNPYFNNFNSSAEQSLIEKLVIESIQIYGIDVWYLPRTLGATDDLLNEDDLPSFNSAHQLEMYIKNVEGFAGEGDFLSKFGLQIRDSMTMTVANKVFEDVVSANTSLTRPNEGDILFFPLNNKMFEIMHVEHEAVFYQMGALQTYDLQVELLEYADQRFNTGVSAIDTLFDDYIQTANTEMDYVEGNDLFADNLTIEDDATPIIDFTVDNPFGDKQY